jgi:hypothetical protein
MDYSNLPGISWNSLRQLFFGDENNVEVKRQNPAETDSKLTEQADLPTSCDIVEDTKVFSAVSELVINELFVNEGLILAAKESPVTDAHSKHDDRFAVLEAQLPVESWTINKHSAENSFNRLASKRRARFQSEQTES